VLHLLSACCRLRPEKRPTGLVLRLTALSKPRNFLCQDWRCVFDFPVWRELAPFWLRFSTGRQLFPILIMVRAASAQDPPTGSAVAHDATGERRRLHQQQQNHGEDHNQSPGAHHARHPHWLSADQHYLKGAAVGPTDSMLDAAAVSVRHSPSDRQQHPAAHNYWHHGPYSGRFTSL
jgi:hypothetical protein